MDSNEIEQSHENYDGRIYAYYNSEDNYSLKDVALDLLSELTEIRKTVSPLVKALRQEEKGYCPSCDGCGDSGCCSPSSCKFVACYYGRSNEKSYRELENETNIMYNKLVELGIDPYSLPGYEVQEDGK